MKASYFFGPAFQGTSEYQDAYDAGHSLAYFCAHCGEIWYRIAVETAKGIPALWNIEYVPCHKHRPSSALDWSRIPGTITDAFCTSTLKLSRMWWAKAVEHLPPEVLKYEFLQLLHYYEGIEHDELDTSRH